MTCLKRAGIKRPASHHSARHLYRARKYDFERRNCIQCSLSILLTSIPHKETQRYATTYRTSVPQPCSIKVICSPRSFAHNIIQNRGKTDCISRWTSVVATSCMTCAALDAAHCSMNIDERSRLVIESAGSTSKD